MSVPPAMEPHEMRPIGVIRSCFKQKFGIPRQPGLAPAAFAELELLPPFNHPDAVRGLEEWSHVWVTFVFHKTIREPSQWKSLTVRPPRLGGSTRVGVFATRATYRPNPIGLSVVKLAGVEIKKSPCRVVLKLAAVDLLDGTPVLDIKPYLPYADIIPSATSSYAPASPPHLAVAFSPHALEQLSQQSPQRYPQLRQLIEQVLRQDPRPATRGAADEDDQGYGMVLYDFNLRWSVSGDGVLVLALDPAPAPKVEAAPKSKAQADPAATATTAVAGKGGARGGKGKGRRVVPDADNPRVKGPHKDMVPMTPEEASAKRLERKRAKKLSKEHGRASAAIRQLKNRQMQQIGDKRAVEAAGVTPFAGPSAGDGDGDQDGPELVSRIKRYPLIDMDDFKRWILFENESLLVLDKPGDVLCHPSKNGPMSSLVGVVKEYTKLPTVHLISRLDRETSGIVLFAKTAAVAHALKLQYEQRSVHKTYFAVVHGNMSEAVTVDQPLGKDHDSPAWVKVKVSNGEDAKAARTRFVPCGAARGGYTLVKAVPSTGRQHQIRAHAAHLGHPLVGDKIYGAGNGELYVTFVRSGWTEQHEAELGIRRQALHCAALDFAAADDSAEGAAVAGYPQRHRAAMPEDLITLCCERMKMDAGEVQAAVEAALAELDDAMPVAE